MGFNIFIGRLSAEFAVGLFYVRSKISVVSKSRKRR